jgi:Flp pilus assembly protein TadD
MKPPTRTKAPKSTKHVGADLSASAFASARPRRSASRVGGQVGSVHIAPRERFGWPAAAIFLVALFVRLIHIWQIREAPFFSVLMGDSRAYDEWAQQVARGDWLGREVFYQAPLYPYFLGVLYSVLGWDLLLVRVCQAILGSLACVLLGLAGWRFFSKGAGLIAGLMLALYAPAIFFDGLIQKSVLDVFFVCLTLALIGAIVRQPEKRSSWAWLGAAVGALSLTRENALVFAAAIVLWILVRDRRPFPRRLAPAGIFVLGLAMVVLPVAVRNAYVGGEFLLTTSQFGPNFYIGNNERADGTYMSLRFGRGAPEYERQDATEIAEQAAGRRLTASEVSSYWTRRALEYIRAQPADWLKLLGRKSALVVNASEMLDTESQASHAEWSAPLRLAGGISHFGVLVPLAIFGMWATWRQRDRPALSAVEGPALSVVEGLWVLYLMMLAYACSVVMFYVFARYRYPLVPFLLLFAAGGLATARDFFRTSPAIRIAGALVAAGAAAVVANTPMLSDDLMRTITETNLASELQEQGRLEQAIAHYRRAIAIEPDYAPAHNNLGVALRAQGQVEAAIEQYEEAIRLYPGYPDARHNLANALVVRGNDLAARGALDDAIVHLRRGVELRADDAAARYDLATTLLEAGRLEDAIRELREVVERTPTSVEAHNNLGIALAQKGKLDEAISHFQEALKLQPGFVDAQRNLATAIEARRQIRR